MGKESIDLVLSSNRGPASLLESLQREYKRATHATIFVAFITEDGARRVLNGLRRISRRGEVRLLTGLYQGFTSPEALRLLLQAEKQSVGKLSVRLSKHPGFHRKVYLMEKKNTSVLVVGSSNLTGDGLMSTGETNLYATLPNTYMTLTRARNQLNAEWLTDTILLTDSNVSAYAKARGKFKGHSPVSKKFLLEILGRETSQPSKNPTVYRWTNITGNVDKETIRAVEENTDWTEFDWCSDPDAKSYLVGDRMFILDLSLKLNPRLQLTKVIDIVETPTRTPDGKWFVAYKVIRNMNKKVNGKMWKRLKEVGITKTSAGSIKKLSPDQIEELTALLKSPQRRRR